VEGLTQPTLAIKGAIRGHSGHFDNWSEIAVLTNNIAISPTAFGRSGG